MKSKAVLLTSVVAIVVAAATAFAYPPAVGILGKSENCLGCHVNNGGWVEGPDLIIDILDAKTKASLKQPDGSFLLSAKRGQTVTVLTVIGYRTTDDELTPYRNAWIYIDPNRINTSSLSKFLPGWELNLPMACRIVGDQLAAYPDAKITALPVTIRPTDAAANGSVTLQVMLTKGDTVKGKAREGMQGNYFERKLHLKIVE